jgi:hypothetical protein
MESIEPVRPKYLLGKITSKYLILEIISCAYYKQKGVISIFKISRSFRTLLRENFKAAVLISEDAISHI